MSHDIKNYPAFPKTTTPDDDLGAQQGMTLHDYFAALALQGILSNASTDVTDIAKIANLSFKYADAMTRRAFQ